jgi:hypothetical protein
MIVILYAIFKPSRELLHWLCNEYNLHKTLEKGTQPDIDFPFLPRSNIVKKLEKIFKFDFHSHYYIISGDHGSGKTTIAKMLSRNVGQGVIYIDMPLDLDQLDSVFEKAFNYKSCKFLLLFCCYYY